MVMVCIPLNCEPEKTFSLNPIISSLEPSIPYINICDKITLIAFCHMCSFFFLDRILLCNSPDLPPSDWLSPQRARVTSVSSHVKTLVQFYMFSDILLLLCVRFSVSVCHKCGAEGGGGVGWGGGAEGSGSWCQIPWSWIDKPL